MISKGGVQMYPALFRSQLIGLVSQGIV